MTSVYNDRELKINISLVLAIEKVSCCSFSALSLKIDTLSESLFFFFFFLPRNEVTIHFCLLTHNE